MSFKYLLVSLFVLPTIANSQTIKVDSNDMVKYEEVIPSELNKVQLYNNAKLFVVKEFSDPKSVVQIDDKENGKIVIKAVMNSNFNEKGILGFKFDIWTDFIFQIDIKDNKYRYRISNLFVDFSGDAVKESAPLEVVIHKAEKKVKAKYKAVVYRNVEQTVHNDMIALIDNLKKQMDGKDDDNF